MWKIKAIALFLIASVLVDITGYEYNNGEHSFNPDGALPAVAQIAPDGSGHGHDHGHDAPTATAVAAQTAASTNQTWNEEDLANCGNVNPPRFGLADVTTHAANTGLRGDELVLAVAIAGWAGSPNPAESCHGQVCAQGDQTLRKGDWGNSVGLWQVRSLNSQHGTGQVRDASRLCDPAFNAQSMLSIRNEQGWNAWTVYSKGYHRANLDAARQHVNERGLS